MTTETEVLSKILDNIHDQLQFAEAKNGVLATIAFALVVGVGAILATAQPPLVAWLHQSLVASAILLAAAGLISLKSFYPVLGLNRDRLAYGQGRNDGNTVFFGDIAEMGQNKFLQLLWDRCRFRGVPTDFHLELAHQITINSTIAATKFRLFKSAITLMFASVVLPPVVFGALEMFGPWWAIVAAFAAVSSVVLLLRM